MSAEIIPLLDDYRPQTTEERLLFVAGLIAWGLAGDDARQREALLAVKALAVNCWDDLDLEAGS